MSSAISSARKQEFANFVVELMVGWAPVQARPMFGGFGVYRDGLMFAILIDETLYFKVDDVSEPQFSSRGLARFSYESKERVASLRYCQAPAEAYDEPAHMALWAKLGYECAVRQQNKKKPARGKKPVRSAKSDEDARALHGDATATAGALSAMQNLGPKSLDMLAKAGITQEAALRSLGAVVAYARTKAACPQASLNLLWALEGALTGRDWKVVAETDRASLLMALEDVQRHML